MNAAVVLSNISQLCASSLYFFLHLIMLLSEPVQYIPCSLNSIDLVCLAKICTECMNIKQQCQSFHSDIQYCSSAASKFYSYQMLHPWTFYLLVCPAKYSSRLFRLSSFYISLIRSSECILPHTIPLLLA